MNNNPVLNKYVALLRGINVGGHHKVPMAELRKELKNLGFTNIVTILNSGNVIFETTKMGIDEMEVTVAQKLEEHFGFPVPVLLRNAKNIRHIWTLNPFKNIKLTKDTRLYVSFLKQDVKAELSLPWISEDHSYQILDIRDKSIFSVLDLAKNKTPKAMDVLEQLFGKGITTRNWNTIHKIIDKLRADQK